MLASAINRCVQNAHGISIDVDLDKCQVKDSVKAAPAPADAPQTAAACPGGNATATPAHGENGRKCGHLLTACSVPFARGVAIIVAAWSWTAICHRVPLPCVLMHS